MSDYKKMYIKLAVAMANSIEEMQKAMQEAEDIYIEKEGIFSVQNFAEKERDESKE